MGDRAKASPERAEIDRVARILIAEWERVEGTPVNVSYLATFVDMARAVIADRVAAQLTVPPPGHVCPVSYGLGPEDLSVLEYMRLRVEQASIGGRINVYADEAAVLGKI